MFSNRDSKESNPRRTVISQYFAVKIYAPNQYGWDKFQRDRLYWQDVPWDNLHNSLLTPDGKLRDYLLYTILRNIPEQVRDSYEYSLPEKLIQCLFDFYSYRGCKTVSDVNQRKVADDVEEIEEYIKSLYLESVQEKIALGYSISLPMILCEIYSKYTMSYEEFIEKQTENFRLYIEPLAQPLVCYLLSQPGVSTYESHTNTIYSPEGYRQEHAFMPNGVWFRVTGSVSEVDSPIAMLHSQRNKADKYYFARLHTLQYERVEGRHVLLVDDIYAVPDKAQRCLYPSKIFDITQPISGNLGFDHIQELQVPPDAKETLSLKEAIAKGTAVAELDLHEQRSLSPHK